MVEQTEDSLDAEFETMKEENIQADREAADTEAVEQGELEIAQQEPAQQEEIKEAPVDKPDTVPLGVFRELRDELKATKAQNSSLEGMVGDLRDRLSKFEERLDPPPSFEDDPLAHLQHQTTQKFDEVKGDIGELKKAIEGNSEQAQVYNLQTRIQEAERQFTQEHPDYPKAFQHIKDARLKQYQILGLDESNWEQEAASYIQTAITLGRNPAEMVYSLAKEMGYQPTEPAPEPKPETKSLKEQAQKIQAAKSLSGAGGSQPKGTVEDMEAADIDNLDDNEFDKMFVGQDSEANWRKLFN